MAELEEAEEARAEGERCGIGRVVRWNRRAQVNYVHCSTGKGNLQAWLNNSNNPETGKHIAPVYIHGRG